MPRTSATSLRYPAMTSSTRSAAGRPLLEASSLRRDSVSGLKCTSMRFSVRRRRDSVKGNWPMRDAAAGGAGWRIVGTRNDGRKPVNGDIRNRNSKLEIRQDPTLSGTRKGWGTQENPKNENRKTKNGQP